MNLNKSKLVLLKGDASFRSFYRKKNNKKNTIIVYSKIDKKKKFVRL